MCKTTEVSTNPTQIAIEINFSDWLSKNGRKGKGCSEKSIASYLSDLRQFLRWFESSTGEQFSPRAITSVDLRSYYNHSIQDERVQATTWNRRRISLSLFCKFMLLKGLIQYNVFEGVPTIEKEEDAVKSLEANEVHKLIRVIEQTVNMANTEGRRYRAIRDRAMAYLMLKAGLRIGEVRDLRKSEIEIQERSGWVRIVNGKHNKQGSVPLGREARFALSQWMIISIEKSDYIFGKLTTKQVERIISKFFHAADIHNHTAHDLRHTFIKTVYDNRGIEAAKRLGRHSRTDQTLRYAKSRWGELQAVVEGL